MKKMMVKLRNSKIEELRILVDAIYTSLKRLLKEQPIAFYDIVMIARDKDYKPFGKNEEVLCQLALINSDNSMHASTRNIILASVEGDILDIKLVNPIMKE